MRKELFKKMLEQAKKEGIDYIGTGSPEGEILIIGKEISIDPENNEQIKRELHNNISDWSIEIERDQNTIKNYDYSLDNYTPLYPYKGQKCIIDNKKPGKDSNQGTSMTWCKYQKLKNYIFQKDIKEIDFHEKFFITELNSSPSKKTKNADKDSITLRKQFIKNSDFFKSFPVVILAGLGYFKVDVDKNINEIEEIFEVKYLKEIKMSEKPTQRYWIHYNNDKKKLVINTRQLSSYISDSLLKAIAIEISEFLKLPSHKNNSL